jgi:3'-phosphoadenosine 5'-phosphosulfate sulfotransferase (PAPS reductase)/FAD synthetase
LSESKYTAADLKEMQSWSLDRKIQVTQTRILEYGLKLDKQIYVSFSGGKDSTVLLDLVRRVFPDTPAVFCDTGLEYPEIRDFVKTVDNVTWVYPCRYDRKSKSYIRTSFREVVNSYGYPLISKEVSRSVYFAKKNIEKGIVTVSLRKMRGELMYNGEKSPYNTEKYAYLLDAPFNIAPTCCYFLKHNPVKVYEKTTGRFPIVGTLAEESRLRRTHWMRDGCNAFGKNTVSKPISFWTEQDILKYIKDFNLPYASRIYGEILQDEQGKYLTTGAQRTGCMFCGFGAHLEKEPNRFQRLKVTHPKIWEYVMKPKEQGGLGMREPLEYIGVKVEDEQITLEDIL